jgi:hypothetical protein
MELQASTDPVEWSIPDTPEGNEAVEQKLVVSGPDTEHLARPSVPITRRKARPMAGFAVLLDPIEERISRLQARSTDATLRHAGRGRRLIRSTAGLPAGTHPIAAARNRMWTGGSARLKVGKTMQQTVPRARFWREDKWQHIRGEPSPRTLPA